MARHRHGLSLKTKQGPNRRLKANLHPAGQEVELEKGRGGSEVSFWGRFDQYRDDGVFPSPNEPWTLKVRAFIIRHRSQPLPRTAGHCSRLVVGHQLCDINLQGLRRFLLTSEGVIQVWNWQIQRSIASQELKTNDRPKQTGVEMLWGMGPRKSSFGPWDNVHTVRFYRKGKG